MATVGKIDVIPAQAGIHFDLRKDREGSHGQQTTGGLHSLVRTTRNTLVGVTGWLRHRVWEHRDGSIEGFTKKHGVKALVWFEIFADFPTAIARETQLKKWKRVWKIELVEKTNPKWIDRWPELIE